MVSDQHDTRQKPTQAGWSAVAVDCALSGVNNVNIFLILNYSQYDIQKCGH